MNDFIEVYSGYMTWTMSMLWPQAVPRRHVPELKEILCLWHECCRNFYTVQISLFYASLKSWTGKETLRACAENYLDFLGKICLLREPSSEVI